MKFSPDARPRIESWLVGGFRSVGRSKAVLDTCQAGASSRGRTLIANTLFLGPKEFGPSIETTPLMALAFVFVLVFEQSSLGGRERERRMEAGGCVPARRGPPGAAFSAVILEVYEVCRNRISFYAREMPRGNLLRGEARRRVSESCLWRRVANTLC
ncbi:hypothetical protein KM043_002590 [Ampulex compressa]|nr:hypothetical protein KM043_002590 [Ampulex compressa]